LAGGAKHVGGHGKSGNLENCKDTPKRIIAKP